jgi:hypothetical protein
VRGEAGLQGVRVVLAWPVRKCHRCFCSSVDCIDPTVHGLVSSSWRGLHSSQGGHAQHDRIESCQPMLPRRSSFYAPCFPACTEAPHWLTPPHTT